MSEKCIRLEIPNNHIVNAVGIQPVFTENKKCNRISIFSLYRYKKWFKNSKNIFYDTHLYKDKTAQIKYDMAFPYSNLEYNVLNEIWKRSLHIKSDILLSEVENNSSTAKTTFVYYSELLRYLNKMNRGTVFITSNKKLYNNAKFAYRQLPKYQRYLLPENVLPQDVMIIMAKGITTFDNPIIAVPFIDKDEYKKFLLENNISDYSTIDMSKRFPIMEKMNMKYDNYQKYINYSIPKKWLIEVFNKPERYYISLHFS